MKTISISIGRSTFELYWTPFPKIYRIKDVTGMTEAQMDAEGWIGGVEMERFLRLDEGIGLVPSDTPKADKNINE